MIPEPFAVTPEQSKERMHNGKLDLHQVHRFLLTLVHFFHGSDTVFHHDGGVSMHVLQWSILVFSHANVNT